MAMTTAGMSAAIVAELDALSPTAEPGGDGVRENFADALAEAIVGYIQQNAEVIVTSVSGVTSGSSSSGPGTGTIE